jgi:MerR family transcriptional regulator, light-induced transcriptional regulator
MNARSEQNAPSLSISAMERETGLSKDTLRVWERRYGFPMPERDALGERLYSAEQLTKLRVICRLIDSGYRPGKIVKMAVEHLESLAQQLVSKSASLAPKLKYEDDLDLLLDLCKTHQIEELRRMLFQASIHMGLERFVNEIVAPLTGKIGEAWAKGSLEVFEEHLYTESMQIVLRNAISNIPSSSRGPRVLLTTFPIESHGLGLLMAEAIMAMHGAKCFSLGIQTPIRDIVRAAQAQSTHAVALSFSSYLNPNQVVEGLTELRQLLPPDVEIWAGGLASVLQKRPLPGIRVITSLEDVPVAIAHWRAVRETAERTLSSN